MAEVRIKLTGEQAEFVRATSDSAESLRRVKSEGADARQELERLNRAHDEGAGAADRGAKATGFFGQQLEQLGRHVTSYIGAWVGIRAVEEALRAHIDHLDKIREINRQLTETAVATQAALTPAASQIFGSTTDKTLAATGEIVRQISESSGLGLGQAAMIAQVSDRMSRLRPGGAAGETDQSALAFAQRFGGVAKMFGITEETDIQLLGEAMQKGGAKTADDVSRIAGQIQAARAVSSARDPGEFARMVAQMAGVEGGLGVPLEETIARAAQFRSVNVQARQAVGQEQRLVEAATSAEPRLRMYLQREAAREGIDRSVLEMSAAERIGLMERSATFYASASPFERGAFMERFGFDQRVMAAFSPAALQARAAAQTAIAGAGPMMPPAMLTMGGMEAADQARQAIGATELARGWRYMYANALEDAKRSPEYLAWRQATSEGVGIMGLQWFGVSDESGIERRAVINAREQARRAMATLSRYGAEGAWEMPAARAAFYQAEEMLGGRESLDASLSRYGYSDARMKLLFERLAAAMEGVERVLNRGDIKGGKGPQDRGD